jgi:NAD(P)H-dependent FMN reductase
MLDHPLKLAVIVGSNREGRFADIVGQWFSQCTDVRDDFEVDYIDLAELQLPYYLPKEHDANVRDYISRIDAANAFVVITPEYNHGYPAALKQAIDLAHQEWMAKPVAFVSYGGISGGLRAVEQLRQVFAELHATTVRDTVSFHLVSRAFDETGKPIDPTGPAEAAERMLDQLAWWAHALRSAREVRPFAIAP